LGIQIIREFYPILSRTLSLEFPIRFDSQAVLDRATHC
jgi:hypothetical protein